MKKNFEKPEEVDKKLSEKVSGKFTEKVYNNLKNKNIKV